MKRRVNVSLDTETIQALKFLAYKNHTNASQLVTRLVWDAMAPKEDFMNPPTESKPLVN